MDGGQGTGVGAGEGSVTPHRMSSQRFGPRVLWSADNGPNKGRAKPINVISAKYMTSAVKRPK